jgi:hypothetical protein
MLEVAAEADSSTYEYISVPETNDRLITAIY